MTAPDLKFVVHGNPKPQGSKRAYVVSGRAVVVDDNKKDLRTWRSDVVAVACDAMTAAGWPNVPPEGPFGVHLTFRLQRPKSVKREWPSVKPDVDKLARGALDAFTAAGVFRDDAQVVRLVVDKEYGDKPGLTARIYSYEQLPQGRTHGN